MATVSVSPSCCFDSASQAEPWHARLAAVEAHLTDYGRGHATDVVSDLELVRHSWMQTHNYVSGLAGLEGLGC